MLSKFTETLRSAAGHVYWASPHLLSYTTGKVVILMYHRVVPEAEVASTYVQPGMYVTTDTFERHLQFLTDHFEPLTFHELLSKWEDGGWNHKARYCVVTFDDGWIDNYQHAYPRLRKYGVPATIFLPTRFIGTCDRLWTDRLGDLLHTRRDGTPADWDSQIERAKSLSDDERERLLRTIAAEVAAPAPAARRFVNWDEVAEMSRHGIAFGSHSSSHANLTRLSDEALERELREPIETLRSRGVNHVPVLAYPNGSHSTAVVNAARAAGYRAAVTVRRGAELFFPRDWFRLRRVAIHEDVTRSASTLALHIGRQLL